MNEDDAAPAGSTSGPVPVDNTIPVVERQSESSVQQASFGAASGIVKDKPQGSFPEADVEQAIQDVVGALNVTYCEKLQRKLVFQPFDDLDDEAAAKCLRNILDVLVAAQDIPEIYQALSDMDGVALR